MFIGLAEAPLLILLRSIVRSTGSEFVVWALGKTSWNIFGVACGMSNLLKAMFVLRRLFHCAPLVPLYGYTRGSELVAHLDSASRSPIECINESDAALIASLSLSSTALLMAHQLDRPCLTGVASHTGVTEEFLVYLGHCPWRIFSS